MNQFLIYGCIALSFATCAINGEVLRKEEKDLFSQERIIYPGESSVHDAGKVLGAGAVVGDNFIYIGGSADYQAQDYFSSTCDVLTLGKEDSEHTHTVFDKCLDLPRSSLAATVLNDDMMLVFGGSTEDGSNTDTVDVLTLEKQASDVLALHVTSEAGKIGKSKSFAQAVSTDKYVYVVGGIHDILMENSDIDYFYLTSSKQLKHKTIRYENLRLFHALVATEDSVFIAGGFTSTFESDLVEVYSENMHYFSGGFLAPMHLSAPRQGLTGTGNKQLLIFAGGAYDREHDFDGKIDFASDKNWKCAETTTKCVSSHVDIYNLKDKAWALESLSEARTTLGSSSDDRYFVFAGGLLEDETTISSKFDVYDSSSGSWEVYELPLARYMAEVAIVNSRVFVAGGIVHDTDASDGEEFSTTSTIDIFDLKTKQWLTSDYLNFMVGANDIEVIE